MEETRDELQGLLRTPDNAIYQTLMDWQQALTDSEQALERLYRTWMEMQVE